MLKKYCCIVKEWGYINEKLAFFHDCQPHQVHQQLSELFQGFNMAI